MLYALCAYGKMTMVRSECLNLTYTSLVQKKNTSLQLYIYVVAVMLHACNQQYESKHQTKRQHFNLKILKCNPVLADVANPPLCRR